MKPRTRCPVPMLPLILVAAFAALLPGCGKKEEKTNVKPAEDNKQEVEGVKGPHGGQTFHFASGHDILGEVVFSKEQRKIEIYIIDHNYTKNKQGIIASDASITLTGLKHDGEDLPDVTLSAAPLEGEEGGSSHFEAAGDAVPKDVDELHALHGATFEVTIDGKSRKATVKVDEKPHEDHHDGHDDD